MPALPAVAANGSSSVEVTLSVFIAVSCAAFLLGLAKGGFSGISPLLTLVIALTVPTKVAIGVLLPMLMIGDVLGLWAHWRHWNTAIVLRLVPAAAVGVLLGAFVLQSISGSGLRIGIVIVTVAFVMYRLSEPRIRARAQQRKRSISEPFVPSTGRRTLAPAWGWLAGATSGVTSTIAHVGGPPIAVYLLTARVPPRQYVATSAALFFVINWMKVPGYIANDLLDVELLATLAPTALLIAPGVLLGRAFVSRVSQRIFDHLILAALVLGAVLLVV